MSNQYVKSRENIIGGCPVTRDKCIRLIYTSILVSPTDLHQSPLDEGKGDGGGGMGDLLVQSQNSIFDLDPFFGQKIEFFDFVKTERILAFGNLGGGRLAREKG